jgi:uncharacterized membrane protein
MPDNAPQKTVFGISENLAGLLCYVLGWITGILFLLVEKENQFVRFHALQSLVTFLSLFVLSFLLVFIPVINLFSLVLIPLISLVLWLLLMVKAYQGEKYKLPYIGVWCEQQLNRNISV